MIDWALETMLASTLLMLLVLALRRPVAAAFGARVAYALWALPALRMVLPALPGGSLLFAQGPVAPVMAVAADPVALAVPVAAAPSLDIALLLLVFWAAGALLWLGWQGWRYQRFMARALAGAEAIDRTAGVDVLLSAAVAGPLAAGIRHRRILLPADFATRYTADERRLALAHEGAHHRRGDLLANLAALAVVALHWWNPVAHWALRAFRTDQELACDATVLADAAPGERFAYGRAVLKSACAAAPVAACAMPTAPAATCAMNDKSHLKQRIVMMRERPLGRLRRIAGVASVAGLVLGGLLVSASGRAPAPVAPVAPVAPPAPVAPLPAVASVAAVGPRATAAPVSPQAPPAVAAAISPTTSPSPPAPPTPPSPPTPVATTRVFMIRNSTPLAVDAAATAADAAGGAADVAGVAADMARVEADVAARHAHRALLLSSAGIVMTSEARPGNMVVTMAPDATGNMVRTTRRFVLRCPPPQPDGAPDAPRSIACAGQGGALALAMVDRAGLDANIAASLRAARQQIEAGAGLSEAQRRKALAGLDTALREVQQQLDSLR